ncbi:MAG: hypothetical protein ACRC8S_22630 [Fimbriiglobus sp.]
MPLVNVSVSEIERGLLPPVCVYCGAKSTRTKKFRVSTAKFWDRPVYFLPTCQRHGARYLWPELLVLLMHIGFVVGLSVGVGFAAAVGPPRLIPLVSALTFAQFAAAMFLGIFLSLWYPSVQRISRGELRLAFVHKSFTSTVEDWRDWYHDHPRASLTTLHADPESQLTGDDEE